MPDHGPAEWLADNLGFFTKQTETYSVKEFLVRYAKFLSVVHQRTVLLAELDYDEVFVGSANKGLDLDDALARAYENLASQGEANKVLLSTFGRTSHSSKEGLEVTLEAQYNRKHGHGKPAIEIRMLGIPSILVKEPQEGVKEYKARIRRLFQELSDVEKEKFARRYENTAKILLRDYRLLLRKFFAVAKTTLWLHLEWGKTGGGELRPRVKL